MTLFLELLFVGVSLQSFFFYGANLPVFAIVSLAMMAAVLFATRQGEIRIPMNLASSVAIWYLVAFVWAAIGLLSYGEAANTKRILAFVIAVSAVLVAVMLHSRLSLERLVRTFLIVHLVFFGLQFAVYYTTGYAIDFLAPITGEEQRMGGGSVTIPGTRIMMLRAAGLFVEPGTYVTFLAPYVALFDRWYGESKLNKRVYWAGLASLFASFSLFGLVFGALIMLFSKHIRRGWRIAGLVAGLVLVAPVLYYRFVVRPSFGLDTGLEFRQAIISESIKFLWSDPIGFVFGSNLLVLDPRVPFVGAFNDVGLLLFLAHFAGPLITLAFSAVVIYAAVKSDRASRVAVLVIMLSKHSPFAPFFPFVLVSIFWRNWAVARKASAA